MLENPEAGRYERDTQQKETPVQAQHDGDTADEEHHVAENAEQCIGGNPLDLTNVAVEARHEIAQTETGVEARREPLQVAEKRQPHIKEHGGGVNGVGSYVAWRKSANKERGITKSQPVGKGPREAKSIPKGSVNSKLNTSKGVIPESNIDKFKRVGESTSDGHPGRRAHILLADHIYRTMKC